MNACREALLELVLTWPIATGVLIAGLFIAAHELFNYIRRTKCGL